MNEDQNDELEALQSIFEEHELVIHSTQPVKLTLFMKARDEDEKDRVIELDMEWPDAYPSVPPVFSFPSDKLKEDIQRDILASLESVLEDFEGTGCTFAVVDHIRDNFDSYRLNRHDLGACTDHESLWSGAVRKRAEEAAPPAPAPEPVFTEVKAAPMTKAAKRRAGDRLVGKGELPRGHDWIDVVGHLRKTGGGDDV